MPHLKLHSSGHLQLHSSGHLKLGGSWHDIYLSSYDDFAGFSEIKHLADYAGNTGGENKDPNGFLSTAKTQAESAFSTDSFGSKALISGRVGYHGYQVYPLGWPGDMVVSASCYGRWQRYATGGITATSVKISTTGTVSARIGVFGAVPSASQIKGATGTSAGVYLFNESDVNLFNANDYIWVSIFIPVPTGLVIPVAQNTNAAAWDPERDPPQYYLGTQFDYVMYWKNSDEPNKKEETASLNNYLNVYY